jgi:hypothetical protein
MFHMLTMPNLDTSVKYKLITSKFINAKILNV